MFDLMIFLEYSAWKYFSFTFLQDYNGHVFWDQDTWMFPPLALLHADFGRQIAGTRLRTHGTAKLYAKMSDLKGARYPWESAFTGRGHSCTCLHFQEKLNSHTCKSNSSPQAQKKNKGTRCCWESAFSFTGRVCKWLLASIVKKKYTAVRVKAHLSKTNECMWR